jgi:hypothetical protein
MLYQRANFNFSTSAINWIVNRYREKFDQNFNHDLDAEQYTDAAQAQWLSSPAGAELVDFLSTYNLDTSYYGISAFISNCADTFIGNPHVDARFDLRGNPSEIKSRFNVLVQGNSTDQMVWWPSCTYWDTRLEPKVFQLNGQTFKHKSVPGNDPESRWAWLGDPEHIENDLLRPSAFVRTNCVHTVTVSAGPRIIVTVALNKTLDEIFGP